MRPIRPRIIKELKKAIPNPDKVAHSKPFLVSTYDELVRIIARIAYANKDLMLFFRGQDQDYKNKAGASTFYPSIYRKDPLLRSDLLNNFDLLWASADLLLQYYADHKMDGRFDLRRRKYIQWSILQHYEVCATPLLDFTQSIRVACSFALNGNKGENGFVTVFGFPYLTNRISINSEHDLINVRLLSIAPPDAQRPYFQEGYLAGTADIEMDYINKTELDFNKRLVAKFAIPTAKSFWGKGTAAVPNSSLYPRNDRVQDICSAIKTKAIHSINRTELGNFLLVWQEIEQSLQQKAHSLRIDSPSTINILRSLEKKKAVSVSLIDTIQSIRKFRNKVVHSAMEADNKTLLLFTDRATEVLRDLKRKKPT